MAGLSFLVSPQSEQQSESQTRDFQAAYSAQMQSDRALQAQAAQLQRAELAQKAQDERQQDHDREMLLLQANTEKAAADRTEKQTAKAFTLAEAAQARKQFYDVISGAKSQLKNLTEDRSGRYDPKFTTRYVPELSQSIARDEQKFNTYMQSFLSTAKEGESPKFDFTDMETSQLQASEINPDLQASLALRNQNLTSQITTRAQRLKLAHEIAERQGSKVDAKTRAIVDQFVASKSALAAAQGVRDNYVATFKNPDKYRLKALDEAVNLAKGQYDQTASVYGVNAQAGLIPDVLRTAVEGDPDGTGLQSFLSGSGARQQDTQSNPTADANAITQQANTGLLNWQMTPATGSTPTTPSYGTQSGFLTGGQQ